MLLAMMAINIIINNDDKYNIVGMMMMMGIIMK